MRSVCFASIEFQEFILLAVPGDDSHAEGHASSTADFLRYGYLKLQSNPACCSSSPDNLNTKRQTHKTNSCRLDFGCIVLGRLIVGELGLHLVGMHASLGAPIAFNPNTIRSRSTAMALRA